MLGLLNIAVHGVAHVVKAVQNKKYDAKSKQDSIDNGRDFYLDHNHWRRNLQNNHREMRQTDVNTRDYVIVDLDDNDSIARNFTKEQHDKKIFQKNLEAKKKGEKYFFDTENKYYYNHSLLFQKMYSFSEFIGLELYRKVDSEELYRIVSPNMYLKYYMNMRTGMLEDINEKSVEFCNKMIQKKRDRNYFANELNTIKESVSLFEKSENLQSFEKADLNNLYKKLDIYQKKYDEEQKNIEEKISNDFYKIYFNDLVDDSTTEVLIGKDPKDVMELYNMKQKQYKAVHMVYKKA